MRYALAILFVFLATPPAAAQTDTATLSADLGSLARLTLSSSNLSFPDADPDAAPQVTALPGPVTITARARATAGSTVVLTVRASDDLRSGVTTLPASLITWTATGAGFVPGTLSSTAPVPVASWIGSGVRTGTQTFFFQNSWQHPSGTYTLTMLYTLAAP